MARSSVFGWVVNYVSLVPVVGEAVMRLRNFLIMKSILQGGVAERGEYPAGAAERNVNSGQSSRALPRLLEPAPKLGRVGRTRPRITAA